MGKSKDNGFTEREHFEAVSRVGRLFEKSHYVSSAPDKNGNTDIKCVKRYDTSLTLRNGKRAVAHITVKEYPDGSNKLYSLELMKK